MRPAQIISLMELGPPTFTMSDHNDHIHVGYTFHDLRHSPAARRDPQGRAVAAPDPAPRGDPEPEGAERSRRTQRCPPRAAITTTNGENRARTPKPSITPSHLRPARAGRRIGLPEGRYLVREGDAERVLIVQELDAPPPRRRRRRARPVEPAEPEQVLARVTVTGVALEGRRRDPPGSGRPPGTASEGTEELRAATRIVNRALSARCRRPATHWCRRSARPRALAISFGHGSGDELAEGRWTRPESWHHLAGGGSTTSSPSHAWRLCSRAVTRCIPPRP